MLISQLVKHPLSLRKNMLEVANEYYRLEQVPVPTETVRKKLGVQLALGGVHSGSAFEHWTGYAVTKKQCTTNAHFPHSLVVQKHVLLRLTVIENFCET